MASLKTTVGVFLLSNFDRYELSPVSFRSRAALTSSRTGAYVSLRNMKLARVITPDYIEINKQLVD